MSARASHDRAPVEHFERLARGSEDPWDYATSEYEQGKYRRTLDYLPERTGRTLELGCSVGVFTAMLAPRCEPLVAVDFSPTALARARERLGDAGNVELLRRRLPEELPDGPFDTGGRLDRARRDLETFLLQHRLEPLLTRLGAQRLTQR